MRSMYNVYACPYCYTQTMYNSGYPNWNPMPNVNPPHYSPYAYPVTSPQETPTNNPIMLKDYGPNPFVINIESATKQNDTYRTALWTGKHLQLTLMSIDVGDDVGLEVHPHIDQFVRIEDGQGLVVMGDTKDHLNFQQEVFSDYAIFIPAGKWHNLINTGHKPIKLYTIYAPVQHPYGTVQQTKAIAKAQERH